VEKMKEDARANESPDKAARETTEKINPADGLLIQTAKQLKEFGEKLPADKKAPIETALNKLKDAHKSQDVAAIDAAVAEMNNAWTAASEELYKATQQAGGQPGDGPHNGGQQASTGGENVTDAEFEEVK